MRAVAVLSALAAGALVLGAALRHPLAGALIAGLLCLAAVARARAVRVAPAGEVQVVVTPDGVTVAPPGSQPSSIGWAQLVEVAVVTTSDGPLADDVFLLLRGADGSACLVPSPLAADLLARLVRLPGFDHERFITAMASTSDAGFLCWRGRPGEALVAAEAPPPGARRGPEPR